MPLQRNGDFRAGIASLNDTQICWTGYEIAGVSWRDGSEVSCWDGVRINAKKFVIAMCSMDVVNAAAIRRRDKFFLQYQYAFVGYSTVWGVSADFPPVI
jgi:hypothetical protein